MPLRHSSMSPTLDSDMSWWFFYSWRRKLSLVIRYLFFLLFNRDNLTSLNGKSDIWIWRVEAASLTQTQDVSRRPFFTTRRRSSTPRGPRAESFRLPACQPASRQASLLAKVGPSSLNTVWWLETWHNVQIAWSTQVSKLHAHKSPGTCTLLHRSLLQKFNHLR